MNENPVKSLDQPSWPRTIDGFSERLRAEMKASNPDLADRIAKILEAVRVYEQAIEAPTVIEVARKLGMLDSGPPSRATLDERRSAAAYTLRALVDDLPELRAQQLVEPPSTTELTPEPADPVEEEVLTPHDHLSERIDPEVEALWVEYREVASELDTAQNNLFESWAEELACRARALQARGLADPDDVLTRMFRQLTAKAYGRQIRNIFGLARSHHGDWNGRAERARIERERLQAPPSREVVATRIIIPAELRASVAAAATELSVDEELAHFPSMPQLLPRCVDKSLVLLGGIVKQEKLGRLQDHFGQNVEWIATDGKGAPRAIDALTTRVREGRVCAVIVFEQLIGHRHFNPVVEAARFANIPLAYGAKAGKGTIVQALQSIEEMLAPAESR